MNTTTTVEAKFAVEGHGQGILCVRGNDSRSFANRYSREAKFTRRQAWDLAKEMMRDGDRYHTVHVKPFAYAGREQAVFTAYRTTDGWVNAKTGEKIAL